MSGMYQLTAASQVLRGVATGAYLQIVVMPLHYPTIRLQLCFPQLQTERSMRRM